MIKDILKKSFICLLQKKNNFKPAFPDRHADLIYICSPNNPTGTSLTKADLKAWVDYALENNSIILYDSAYSAYIQEEDVCGSIYEIPDAKKVAIEFKSFSKTAGFTGIRCAFTVVPKSYMLLMIWVIRLHLINCGIEGRQLNLTAYLMLLKEQPKQYILNKV